MDFDKTVIFIICVAILFALVMILNAGNMYSDKNAQINTLKGLNIETLYDANWNSMPNDIHVEKKMMDSFIGLMKTEVIFQIMDGCTSILQMLHQFRRVIYF